jgi:hypothetical protein
MRSTSTRDRKGATERRHRKLVFFVFGREVAVLLAGPFISMAILL